MATPDPSQNRPSQSSDSPSPSGSSSISAAGSGAGSSETAPSSPTSGPGGSGTGSSSSSSSGAGREGTQESRRAETAASSASTGTGSGSIASRGASGSGTASDREMGIATSREGTASATSGVARQDQGRGVRTPGSGMSPFALMRRLSEDMDRVFSEFPFGAFGLFPGLGPSGRTRHRVLSNLMPGLEQAVWAPTVDVFQRDNNLIVHAELPGVPQNNVSVEINDGMLILSGQREQQNEENRGSVYRSERSYGSFYRVIPLPEDADPNQAQAHFKDGVLEVTVPIPQRTLESRARKIEVQS
jgi:HSP20 family protein